MFSSLKVCTVILFITCSHRVTSSKFNDRYHEMLHENPKNNGRGFSANIGKNKISPPAEMDSRFWFENAQRTVKQKTDGGSRFINKMAKNIIFFLGDGMSIGTLTAARILKGQRLGHTGEESILNVEKFPYTGLSKVCP